MSDIRMIASDMDGTLLNSRLEISPVTAQAIRCAQAKGVLFSVCSGRFPQFTSQKLFEAGISCPVIGANGGLLWDDQKREVFASYPMDTASAVAAHTLLQKYGAYSYIFHPNAIVTTMEDRPHPYASWQDSILSRKYGMHFDCGFKAACRAVESGLTVKFFISLKNVEHVEALKEELFAIPRIYITSSGRNNLEIMRKGVDKCFGVKMLARQHNIAMENVMTFGDYLNDLPMIVAAGMGVAMGNALDEVKELADYVTDINDNNGVAKAIDQFVI